MIGGQYMSSDDNSRKVILDLAVTLDGLIEGENGEIDWCIINFLK